jgi:hypothetical protein
VIDYMIMEAIHLKVQKEDAEAQKRAEQKDWKRDTSKLEDYR